MLRGDIAEQGSSASQMTAAEVMDVIARFPDCDGQAADAVSAHPSKIGGRSQIAQKFLSLNVQTYGYVFHDTNGRNLGQTLKIQWYHLGQNNYSFDALQAYCFGINIKL